MGASALGGLLLIGVSWRLLFHITSAFAGIMAVMLAVAMPDEFPYSLSGGGADYNVGGGPTTAAEVSLDSGAGKVSYHQLLQLKGNVLAASQHLSRGL